MMLRSLIKRWIQGWHRVEYVGGEVPTDGPLIVVANHTGGLIDGALLYAWSPRPLRIVAKYKVFRVPLLALIARLAGSIPVYRKKDNVSMERNAGAFDAVAAALGRGHGIVMLPEGESKTAWRIRTPLKTGAVRMALQAESENDWKLGVKIQPLGIHYSDRDAYRSRVEVRVGEPLLASHMREEDERDNRAAVLSLTTQVEEALRQLTLEARDDEDIPLLSLARRVWYEPGGGHLDRLQALADGLGEARAREDAAIEPLVRRAESLERQLDEANIQPVYGLMDPPAADRGGNALVLLPLLVGRFFWGLPGLAAAAIARVIGQPDDKITSARILMTLPFGVLWAGLLATFAGRAWGPIGAGMVCLLSLTAALRLPALEDSWRAQRGRKRARAAGLADSPSTTPLTREYRLVLSELERIAREHQDSR